MGALEWDRFPSPRKKFLWPVLFCVKQAIFFGVDMATWSSGLPMPSCMGITLGVHYVFHMVTVVLTQAIALGKHRDEAYLKAKDNNFDVGFKFVFFFYVMSVLNFCILPAFGLDYIMPYLLPVEKALYRMLMDRSMWVFEVVLGLGWTRGSTMHLMLDFNLFLALSAVSIKTFAGFAQFIAIDTAFWFFKLWKWQRNVQTEFKFESRPTSFFENLLFDNFGHPESVAKWVENKDDQKKCRTATRGMFLALESMTLTTNYMVLVLCFLTNNDAVQNATISKSGFSKLFFPQGFNSFVVCSSMLVFSFMQDAVVFTLLLKNGVDFYPTLKIMTGGSIFGTLRVWFSMALSQWQLYVLIEAASIADGMGILQD
mmetsp:Transcript_52896/g.94896  ORF Transcript_52896/g.94896 Transcript_52896/m.94896 type:complete len:370 (-) Transcript_52896:93-1202(-)